MNGWYFVGYWLSRLFFRVFFRLKIVNRKNLLEDGGVIYAANHASYFDPPVIGVCCRKAIFFLARKTLLNWPVLGPIFPKINVVPVDQERADMSALKTIIKLVREGHRTIIFPEGSRTPDGNLQPAQPGIGLVVAKTLAPVVPMRIFGSYEAFPKGAKGIRFTKITVVVGKPIHFTEADIVGGRDAYQRISERVMTEIAKLSL
ncbi:MAG TPA: lysophospholipid acyltransferase family protein [Chthoniobacterales bacterium]